MIFRVARRGEAPLKPEPIDFVAWLLVKEPSLRRGCLENGNIDGLTLIIFDFHRIDAATSVGESMSILSSLSEFISNFFTTTKQYFLQFFYNSIDL